MWARTRVLIYLASSETTFEHHYGHGQVFMDSFAVCFTGLWMQIRFTGFNRKLYGHGIQSFLLCVLSIALSIASTPIASYSMASSLYAALPIALMIVRFDGTSILSLHNIELHSNCASLYTNS
jgi:hypothetical protein